MGSRHEPHRVDRHPRRRLRRAGREPVRRARESVFTCSCATDDIQLARTTTCLQRTVVFGAAAVAGACSYKPLFGARVYTAGVWRSAAANLFAISSWSAAGFRSVR